ncbi:MAG: hypothetical protein KC535_03155 [Nanoarchaeota archaeon]|nr:hypothetical protein [Nanoarchaeota archaeon]
MKRALAYGLVSLLMFAPLKTGKEPALSSQEIKRIEKSVHKPVYLPDYADFFEGETVKYTLVATYFPDDSLRSLTSPSRIGLFADVRRAIDYTKATYPETYRTKLSDVIDSCSLAYKYDLKSIEIIMR